MRNKQKLIKKRLAKESKLVQKTSMEALREFEKLENPILEVKVLRQDIDTKKSK